MHGEVISFGCNSQPYDACWPIKFLPSARMRLKSSMQISHKWTPLLYFSKLLDRLLFFILLNKAFFFLLVLSAKPWDSSPSWIGLAGRPCLRRSEGKWTSYLEPAPHSYPGSRVEWMPLAPTLTHDRAGMALLVAGQGASNFKVVGHLRKKPWQIDLNRYMWF